MIDWAALFVPQNAIAETMIRGTLIYLLLFLVLRFFMNRQAGAVGIPDILVIVLIVEATTDALGKNESISDTAILIFTITFWSFSIQWICYHVPALEFLIASPKVKLIENGKILRRNMRRELVTDEELMSLLRTQGVDDPRDVKSAYIEGSGDISVIRNDDGDTSPGRKGADAAM